MTYNSYDPGALTPVCPGGTNGIQWFAADTTTLGTATNLASKLDESILWSVALTGTIGDPAAGGSYQFTFSSSAPAFEFDESFILDGIGTMLRGYYTLRSPTLDGAYLECKIETRKTNNSGGFFTYDGGTPKLCITITASGGGTYYMPFMPGSYNFCGNNHQFAIWPKVGQVASRNANTSLFVSLIQAPAGRATGGSCPVVIGSNNGDLNIYPDHLRTQLHWSQSLGTGHNATLASTVYRGGQNAGYLRVALLVRGTKTRPTVSLSGQPLVQAPYIAIPDSPNDGGSEPAIVGKLWDIVTTSGNAGLGAMMLNGGKRWTCFSTTTPTGDVGCDMWILTDPS